MRPAMFGIFVAAWIVAFLLSALSIWVVVAIHGWLGLWWTAGILSGISIISMAFKLSDRAGGGDA